MGVKLASGILMPWETLRHGDKEGLGDTACKANQRYKMNKQGTDDERR